MPRAVHVSAIAERHRLSVKFPELAEHFIRLALTLPHVEVLSDERIVSENSRPQVEELFVGRDDAIRKELDVLLGALQMLGIYDCGRANITTISSFADGDCYSTPGGLMFVPHADMPAVPDGRLYPKVILSRFASHCFTVIDAMAQGTVRIVANWEVSNEIIEYGNLGGVANPELQSVVTHIKRLLSDAVAHWHRAAAAAARHCTEYFPEEVAQRHAVAFLRCLGPY